VRSVLLAACLLVTTGATADPVAPDLEPGARGKVLTALSGGRIEEIPLSFLGTYRDFAGPGYDLHLVKLEGERAEHFGVAAGMSGSPVYVDGRLIGALAYRLGALPKQPIGGVTPIEDILDGSPLRSSPSSSAQHGASVAPIATPIHVGGLAPAAREWITPHLEERGFVVVAGGTGSDDGSGSPKRLEPGSPVGVELVRGDVRMAATGTVTWVDGDRVYAFGHPFLGTGPTELPMVAAEVIHTLADMAGSLKLANVGAELGAVIEDRQSTIVGRLGARARMIPVTLKVRGGNYGKRDYGFEVARSSDLTPLLAGLAVANSLLNNTGYLRQSTLLARGTVRLEGLPDVPLEMAFAGTRNSDPAIGVAADLFATLGRLWTNPFEEVEIKAVDLSIEVHPELVSYEVESLHFDRGTLAPGESLDVRCVLREYRGETVTREFSIPLPEQLPRSGTLVLAVSNPEGIDQVLGRLIDRRLASATDLHAIVEALGDRRSRHRLTAVVYEPGGSVVSRGVAYSELPPTAERLLSLQTGAGRRQNGRGVSPLVRVEQELDGPVEGGKQVRLRIDRGVRGEEEN